VSIRHTCRSLLLAATLGFASLIDLPMRAEEVEEIMHNLSKPKIAHTLPVDHDQGDDLLMRLLRRLKLYR
jgi:hypothetical protein